MTSLEIKQLLDEKYQEYCHSDFFIHTDPIQIPKLFEEKEDIEIAGFLAASLAWGQRPTIIKKCMTSSCMPGKAISPVSNISNTALSTVMTVVIFYVP